ncbi:hypothetical protein ABZW30_12615 [Kitasatospora sp. NPDC004669]|uniref:hypothetical protein n=1 Tax=Kitasatospora sp. NPDC004669 TaxID=3154555 RepID=UPI0033B321BE
MKPTDIITISDIAEITGVADVVIDGTALWVSPGITPTGRYWTLFTPSHLLAGVVVELEDGSFDAVIGTRTAHADSAQDAAVAIVAALRGAR